MPSWNAKVNFIFQKVHFFHYIHISFYMYLNISNLRHGFTSHKAHRWGHSYKMQVYLDFHLAGALILGTPSPLKPYFTLGNSKNHNLGLLTKIKYPTQHKSLFTLELQQKSTEHEVERWKFKQEINKDIWMDEWSKCKICKDFNIFCGK